MDHWQSYEDFIPPEPALDLIGGRNNGVSRTLQFYCEILPTSRRQIWYHVPDSSVIVKIRPIPSGMLCQPLNEP